MNKWIYFCGGLVTGVILAFVFAYVVGKVYMNPETEQAQRTQYLEQPVSYEDKKETSFRVFQVLNDAALATEISNKEYKWYNGNTVMILGKDFYTDQIVTIKNPQRVGSFSYESNGGRSMTVPVIDGR
jgi:hypothetical protein